MLESYRTAYPSVDVRVEEVSQRIAGSRLLSRRLDVAFLAGAPEVHGCTTTRMWNERLVVALPKSHRLAELPSLPWDDLREETFLSPANDKGVEMESLLLRKLYESGSSPGISVHDVGRDDLLTLAARGFGVFMTLESTVSEDYRNLAFVPVGDDTDIIEFSAVLLTEQQNLRSRHFCAALRVASSNCLVRQRLQGIEQNCSKFANQSGRWTVGRQNYGEMVRNDWIKGPLNNRIGAIIVGSKGIDDANPHSPTYQIAEIQRQTTFYPAITVDATAVQCGVRLHP
ncbi:LysR family substrate-binding domain-containing protein [Agrobacterium tumefaciens]|nr:LysR family substrate-binding domain-containing protein [Agrobacterium tumefaciens]UXS41535.1 LysR family substrate-binding domain-containing protein [Agrobacterium tumefaciens]